MKSCFGLVRPRQHGIANIPELKVPTERIASVVIIVHLWDVAKNAQAELISSTTVASLRFLWL